MAQQQWHSAFIHDVTAEELDELSFRGDRMTLAEARAATKKPTMFRDRAYVLVPAWFAADVTLPDIRTLFQWDNSFEGDCSPVVYARWFSVTGLDVYLLAYERETETAWVFTVDGQGEAEESAVSVPDLEAARGPSGLPLFERDFLFERMALWEVQRKHGLSTSRLPWASWPSDDR